MGNYTHTPTSALENGKRKEKPKEEKKIFKSENTKLLAGILRTSHSTGGEGGQPRAHLDSYLCLPESTGVNLNIALFPKLKSPWYFSLFIPIGLDAFPKQNAEKSKRNMGYQTLASLPFSFLSHFSMEKQETRPEYWQGCVPHLTTCYRWILPGTYPRNAQVP